ncbi:MAG: hypothetical protein PHY16_03090 [Methylobacter sp.]|nr:hypothetical protein [Methylobacter sp.]
MLQLSRHTGRDCRYPVHRDMFGLLSLASGFRQSLPERRSWNWLKLLANQEN